MVYLNKTEYICCRERQELMLDNGQYVKYCTIYKYLGIKLLKNETLDDAIEEKNLVKEGYRYA